MDDTNQAVTGEIVQNTRVLSNGAIYDNSTGRIIKGPTNPPINAQNAAAMQRRRNEVTRQKIAKAIADKSREQNALVAGPADAVAYAAGMLWHDTVLNSQASDRERRETWLALGKHAGMLSDKRENDAESPNNGAIPANETLTQAIYAALVRMRDEMSGT